MATWDATLPYPDAIDLTPEDINIRTQMEKGPDRVRGRSTSARTQIAQQWTLTGSQLASFRTLFTTTAVNGRDWLTSCPIFTATAFVSETVRFVGTYHATYATYDQWKVTATLEVDGDLS